jgi:hypothetical protein
MRGLQQFVPIAAGALILAASACADRSTGYSEDRNVRPEAASTAAASENRTAVTATGCFQDMSGTNNFVLSNVGDAPGVAPSATRAYRIEQSGDFEQYVGKRVSVKGWVDSDAQTQGASAGAAKSGDLDFNDLPELHVDSISPLSEACGSSAR